MEQRMITIYCLTFVANPLMAEPTTDYSVTPSKS